MESKTVKLDGKVITVRELTVREIKELFDMPDNATMVDRIGAILGKCAFLGKGGSVDEEFILDYSPSDLQPLIDTMVEVNSAFFAQAASVGMEQAAQALRQIMNAVSMIAFSSASSPDTEQ